MIKFGKQRFLKERRAGQEIRSVLEFFHNRFCSSMVACLRRRRSKPSVYGLYKWFRRVRGLTATQAIQWLVFMAWMPF